MLNSPRVRAALESATDPVVVDLGYGRLPVTTLELASRLRTVRPDVRVVGLEIDPERVVPGVDGVEFGVGGFELAGLHPVLVRAFNVLRQYPDDAVADAWDTMRAGLAPGGLILDGTCDELGRLVLLGAARRRRPGEPDPGLRSPAYRTPVGSGRAAAQSPYPPQCSGPADPRTAGRGGSRLGGAAGHSVFGPRDRWRAMLADLRAAGVDVEPQRRTARDAVLTVPWSTVAPLA